MDNKYSFFIIAAIVIMVILSAGKIIGDAMRPLTVESITGHTVDECAVVRAGAAAKKKTKSNLDSFKSRFDTMTFKSINVEADVTTTPTYYLCQDASGATIFTIVDVGNKSDYYIKAGNFDMTTDARGNLYQER